MFILNTFNCLADVFHSVYGKAKRNTNIEDWVSQKGCDHSDITEELLGIQL